MADIFPSPESPSESEPEEQNATLVSGSPFSKPEPAPEAEAEIPQTLVDTPAGEALESQDSGESQDQSASTAVYSRQDVFPAPAEETPPVQESPSMEEVSATVMEVLPPAAEDEPVLETLAESLPPSAATVYSTPEEAPIEDQSLVEVAAAPAEEEETGGATVISGWSPEPELAPVPAEEEVPGPPVASVAGAAAAPEWESGPAVAATSPEPATPHTAPPPPSEAMSVQDERTWAALAHLSVLLNLVTGFLGPVAALAIYFMYKDRSRYVAYHAYQSFLFQLIWWVGAGALAGITWVISGILAVVLIGCLLMPVALLISLVPVAALVYGVIGAIQVSQGQDFKYWLVGDWARSSLND